MRHPLLACALLTLPLSAFAEGFSYTYVDARYAFSDSDATSAQYDGPVVAVSYALPELFGMNSLYVSGGASWLETEKVTIGTASGSFESIDANLRLGTHHAITPILDAFGNAGLAFANTEGKGSFSSFSDDDFSYVVELGLRAQVIERVQMSGAYSFTELRDDTTGSFRVGLEVNVIPQVDVVGAATFARNADGFTVGARYNF